MMWECMELAFKVAIGGILWWVLFFSVLGVFGLVYHFFTKESEEQEPEHSKKPKYKGDPIVINGGKGKDE